MSNTHKGLLVIDPSKPKIKRFGFYLVDPENEDADDDGRCVLEFDTLKIMKLMMESDLVEEAVADKAFTDELGRKFKKGAWLFDKDGARLIRFKHEKKGLSLDETRELNRVAIDLGYKTFGLEEDKITEDQVLSVWMAFMLHVKKNELAINKYMETLNKERAQKKKKCSGGAKRGKLSRSRKGHFKR